jgi:CheY-like chemotaxis protein
LAVQVSWTPVDSSWQSHSVLSRAVVARDVTERKRAEGRLRVTVADTGPGVRLISAMRPQLGLNLAAEHDPDLVLLDLHLPDMHGQEVLRRLRAQARTANVPVVVLSADARPALINELLAQGSGPS